MNILILGVNGFIGHHLSKLILETTAWHVYGMDMQSMRVTDLMDNERFHFLKVTSPSIMNGLNTT